MKYIKSKTRFSTRKKPSSTTKPIAKRKPIKTLSPQDIKSILSSQKKINKNELVYINDKKYRETIYTSTCELLSNMEIDSFPSFGDRKWKCIVKFNEDKRCKNNNDQILFRWMDGEFEVEHLDELLNDVSNSNQESKVPGGGMKNYIDKVWISPQYEQYRNRKEAIENAQELTVQENLINRYIYGIGSKNKLLRPFYPTASQSLEVGLYRFQKDGLWVVGQEESWQQDRAAALKVGYFKNKNKGYYKNWCLPESIQDLCYSACLEHFDSVMYTVKARSLFSELEHGFDVLRERGRGRYDMEIPSFDSITELSSVLNSTNAPWMPIVRTILGEEAVLIHKGCFLSLPGSETQVYHQDGVHLSKTHQRPCHAVNVFIPLIDLTSKNGPTEFCKGTHILGNDHFQKQNLEIPLVEAGTPVIFDYRLGHRGLGNTTIEEVRPILYLSYASSNFRDSVNFSRKRYIKIGEMIKMPISRKERAKKRAEKLKGSFEVESDDSSLVGLIDEKEVKVFVKV